jgi:hypothetical protein
MRYDLRRGNQILALADGFERFAHRLEQQAKLSDWRKFSNWRRQARVRIRRVRLRLHTSAASRATLWIGSGGAFACEHHERAIEPGRALIPIALPVAGLYRADGSLPCRIDRELLGRAAKQHDESGYRDKRIPRRLPAYRFLGIVQIKRHFPPIWTRADSGNKSWFPTQRIRDSRPVKSAMPIFQ